MTMTLSHQNDGGYPWRCDPIDPKDQKGAVNRLSGPGNGIYEEGKGG